MADIREYTDSFLLLANGVEESIEIDLNALGETVLFTVPTGKSCIITKVIMHTSSGALASASISFGFNTANADDVIANGVRPLTGATNYEIIPAKSDAVRGAAAGTFKIDVNTAEGGVLTAKFAVFGFLY